MLLSVLIREETSREVFIPVNSISTRLYAFEIPVVVFPEPWVALTPGMTPGKRK